MQNQLYASGMISTDFGSDSGKGASLYSHVDQVESRVVQVLLNQRVCCEMLCINHAIIQRSNLFRQHADQNFASQEKHKAKNAGNLDLRLPLKAQGALPVIQFKGQVPQELL
jgi:hypothetical protein